MPVNAPAEYFKAEEKFKTAKSRDEKIIALEEMLRLMPRHHGSENALAQLKSRLAKLKKEVPAKKGSKRVGIAKEGEAQVCLMGFTQSGKSSLLGKLTDAKPAISSHPYTTTKPEMGMMDYRGIKIQLVDIPSTFQGEFVSIARTADAIAILIRNDSESFQFCGSNLVILPLISGCQIQGTGKRERQLVDVLFPLGYHALEVGNLHFERHLPCCQSVKLVS